MTAANPSKLVLKYDPFANLLEGSLSGGPVRHAEPAEALHLFLNREDPGALVGFQVEDFALVYPVMDRPTLSSLLGRDVVSALDDFHARAVQARADRPPFPVGEDEQSLRSLLDSNRVRAEVSVAPATQAVRRARKMAAERAFADPAVAPISRLAPVLRAPSLLAGLLRGSMAAAPALRPSVAERMIETVEWPTAQTRLVFELRNTLIGATGVTRPAMARLQAALRVRMSEEALAAGFRPAGRVKLADDTVEAKARVSERGRFSFRLGRIDPEGAPGWLIDPHGVELYLE